MTTNVMTQNIFKTEAERGNGMNGSLPTGANHIVHAQVLSRAVSRLQLKYGPALDGELIRRTVTSIYGTLDRSARIKTFLPAIAVRQAEERLRALAAEGVATTGTAMDDKTAAPVAA